MTTTATSPRATTSVPAGSYALPNWTERRVYFFQVECPTEGKWAGYTFLVKLHGDNRESVRGLEKTRILRAIAENPTRAAALYGKRLGRCPKCNKTLTDPESISRGIGPKCAKHYA